MEPMALTLDILVLSSPCTVGNFPSGHAGWLREEIARKHSFNSEDEGEFWKHQDTHF